MADTPIKIDPNTLQLQDISLCPDLIKNYLGHDDIYKGICNDESITKEDFMKGLCIAPKLIYYFAVTYPSTNEDNTIFNPIGVWIIYVLESNLVSFHAGLYKVYRGQNTPDLLKRCVELTKEYFKNDDIQFMTTTPTSRDMLFQDLFYKAGFKYATTVDKAYADKTSMDIWVQSNE